MAVRYGSPEQCYRNERITGESCVNDQAKIPTKRFTFAQLLLALGVAIALVAIIAGLDHYGWFVLGQP